VLCKKKGKNEVSIVKAKTKTVILSALAVIDCILGGIVISTSFTNDSHTKSVEVKAGANYIDQSVSNVGNDIMITMEAEKVSKELEEASKKLAAEAKAKADAEAKAKAEAAAKKKAAAEKKAAAAKKAAEQKKAAEAKAKKQAAAAKNASYKKYVASVGKDIEHSEVYKQVQAKNPWKGTKLTRSAGVVKGPSGKETYYNLNMSGVVKIMRNQGIKDPYWVRSDGVKMLGNYVMVAASFDIRPRGTIVPTSLGLGIVCDTGTFIYSNPTQLDIAVAW
jgi:flagellar biosynthesis GTPase FlhF